MSKAMLKQLHNSLLRMLWDALLRLLVPHLHHTKKHGPCDTFSRNHEPSYVNVMKLSYLQSMSTYQPSRKYKLSFHFLLNEVSLQNCFPAQKFWICTLQKDGLVHTKNLCTEFYNNLYQFFCNIQPFQYPFFKY